MSFEVDPDWWKDLFDEVYLTTDARSVCDDEVTRKEIDLLQELIPLSPDQEILDLCGGHGRHSRELALRITSYNVCYTKLLRFPLRVRPEAEEAVRCEHGGRPAPGLRAGDREFLFFDVHELVDFPRNNFV